MFERVAASVLNMYLGEYVEGLDTKQLQVAVWQGDVQLEGLTLKADALRSFNLPIVVRAGYISKLTMKIPWTRLQSEPIVLHIDGLYVLAGPAQMGQYSAAAEEAYIQKLKEECLSKLQSATEDKSGDTNAVGGKASLMDQMLDNIQLEINNVHIRYEDATSRPDHPFAAGVSLTKLSAIATDANWKAKYVSEKQIMAHRLVKLENLCMYWNTDAEMIWRQKLKPDKVQSSLEPGVIKSSDDLSPDSEYVLKPVVMEGKLRRNKGAVHLFDVPQILLEIACSQIPFVIDRRQFDDMMTLQEVIQEHKTEKAEQHRFFQRLRWCRPETAIEDVLAPAHEDQRSEVVAAWWRYSIKAAMQDLRDKRPKSFVIDPVQLESRRKLKTLYVGLWVDRLIATDIEPEDQTQLDELEQRLLFTDIRYFRALADRVIANDSDLMEAARNVREARAQAAAGQSWYGWITGYGSSSAAGAAKKESDKGVTLTAEEQEQLFSSRIELNESKSSDVPKSYVATQVTVNLGSCSVTFCDRERNKAKPELAKLELKDLVCHLEQRPTGKALKASISLGTMLLRDLMNDGTLYPLIIQPKSDFVAPSPSKTALFDLSECHKTFSQKDSSFLTASVESNPLEGRANFCIRLRVNPLEVTHNMELFERLIRFMKPSRGDSKQAAAPTSLQNSELSTKPPNQKGRAPSIDVLLDIRAPQIVLPQCCISPNCSIVVADLGHLIVKSSPAERQPVVEDEEPELDKSMSRSMSMSMSRIDDDDFQTPPSTPDSPRTPEGCEVPQADTLLLLQDTEKKLRAACFDTYTLELSQIQVIAGKTSDDWRSSLKASVGSRIHVVNQFTVTCSVLRCLTPSDPEMINLDISGNLPLLSICVAERKLKSLLQCVGSLSSTSSNTPKTAVAEESKPQMFPSSPKRQNKKLMQNLEKKKLKVNFTIGDFRVLVDAGSAVEKPLVGIKVTGVNANFMQRQYDESLTFVVADLLVTDYLQPPGSEFRELISTFSGTEDAKFVKLNYTHIIKTPDPARMGRYHGLTNEDHYFPIDFQFTTPMHTKSGKKVIAQVAPHVIELSLNTLHVNVNRRTVAALLDFFHGAFGSGNKSRTEPSPTEKQFHRASSSSPSLRKFKLTADVGHLGLVLLKHGKRMAKVTIGGISARVDSLTDSMFLAGRMGQITVTDETPPGRLYSEVFTTTGDEILKFDIFKRQGQSLANPPDGEIMPEGFNVRMRMEMASVRYVHTQRFLKQLTKYIAHFNEMQMILKRMRSAAEGIIAEAHRSESHVLLDILVNRPVVLIPRNSFSEHYIEADLGKMTIQNELKVAPPLPAHLHSDGGTDKERGRIDSIHIDIKDMNLYSGQNVDSRSSTPTTVDPLILWSNLDDESARGSTSSDSDSKTDSPSREFRTSSAGQGSTPVTDLRKHLVAECSIALDWDRNLQATRHDLPNTRISGNMSNVEISATHSQYELFMGVLGENFGCESDLLLVEDFSEFGSSTEPSSPWSSKPDSTIQLSAASTSSSSTSLADFDPELQPPSPHRDAFTQGLPGESMYLSAIGGSAVLMGPSEEEVVQAVRQRAEFGIAKWVSLELTLFLENVSLKLSMDGETDQSEEEPLAKFDFIQSTFAYTSFTDGTPKDCGSATTIDSKSIIAHDMRQASRNSKFTQILQPTNLDRNGSDPSPQLQITYRASPEFAKLHMILNKARVIVALDWLMAVKGFLFNRAPSQLTELANRPNVSEKVEASTPQRSFDFTVSVTEPEFILVENPTRIDTTALVLKFCSVFHYKNAPGDPDHGGFGTASPLPNQGNVESTQTVDWVVEELEIFSCRLNQQAATALSILDPCKLSLELIKRNREEKSSDTGIQVEFASWSRSARGKNVAPPVYARVSYTDIRLFNRLLSLLSQSLKAKPPTSRSHRKSSSQVRAADVKKVAAAVHHEHIRRLRKMGFPADRCIIALSKCQGSVDRAAFWLCEEATSARNVSNTASRKSSGASSSKTITNSFSRLGLDAPASPSGMLRVASSGQTRHDRKVELEQQLNLAEKELRNRMEEQPIGESVAADAAEEINGIRGHIEDLNEQIENLMSSPKEYFQSSSVQLDDMQSLVELGYAEDDCLLALKVTRGNLAAARVWLADNAPPVLQTAAKEPKRHLKSPRKNEGPTKVAATSKRPLQRLTSLDRNMMRASSSGMSVTKQSFGSRIDGAVQSAHLQYSRAQSDIIPEAVHRMTILVRSDGCCLCVIDDREGRDTPLAELNVKNLEASLSRTSTSMIKDMMGRLSGCLSCEYYNTTLSCWEPVVEPWVAAMTFKTKEKEERKVDVRILAEEKLDINVTPVLLDIASTTMKSWASLIHEGDKAIERKRFVPYRIKNRTGRPITIWCEAGGKKHPTPLSLDVDKETDFDFLEGREKLRHVATHLNVIHKISVRVAGWQEVRPPITVDRVGVFGHMMQPESKEIESARMIVSVSVKDGRKEIDVRSALVVSNSLTIPLDIRLDFSDLTNRENQSSSIISGLLPGATAPVPIHMTSSVIKIRPHGWGYQWSTIGISWENFSGPASNGRVGIGLVCRSIGDDQSQRFRCCVSVVKEKLPPSHTPAPGHTLTILPPLVLANLLPVDFQYIIEGTTTRGELLSGKSQALYEVNIKQDLRVRIKVPGFEWSDAAIVNTEEHRGVDTTLLMRDGKRRELRLNIINKRMAGSGGARTVSISSQYWIINNTGLPLIYKQHLRSQTAAGQTSDIKSLCDSSPFMFSCDEESLTGNKCHVRVGETSEWSPELTIDVVGRVGTCFCVQRKREKQPQKAYEFGVEISRGKNRFLSTKIVTLVPRYVLVNGTDQNIQFGQSSMIDSNQFSHMPPRCSLPFHWARVDAAHNMRIRLQQSKGPEWHWCAPFPIDEVGTSHVKLYRIGTDTITLVRVEVRLTGAAFQVIFTDAQETPPFRIDNQSHVSLLYHQTGTTKSAELLPQSCAPYAWDDLTKTLLLEVCVKGVPMTCAKNFDLHSLGDAGVLYYPQYFLIMGPGNLVVGSLPDNPRRPCLVKRTGGPHELWQITKQGRLRNRAGEQLEITEKEVVQLRKAHQHEMVLERQLWKLEQGRLLNLSLGARSSEIKDMICLQAIVDTSGRAKEGDYVTIAPVVEPLMTSQSFSFHNIPPGSGALSVHIYADGQTRVMSIRDCRKDKTDRGDEWVQVGSGGKVHETIGSKSSLSDMQLSVEVHLPGGLGLSVVDDSPKELLYFSSRGIDVFYTLQAKAHQISLTVQHAQIDNQLHQFAKFPVIMHPLPRTKDKGLPLLSLSAVISRESSSSSVVFKTVEASVVPFCLYLDEEVLLKLIQLAKGRHTPLLSVPENMMTSESWNANSREDMSISTAHPLDVETAQSPYKHANSTYFEVLHVGGIRVTISLLTASELSPDLLRLKASLGLSNLLVAFESALMNLQGFKLQRPFTNRDLLFSLLLRHYKQELLRQAYKILGSVDFLGNPYGIIQNVRTGWDEFVNASASGNVLNGGVRLASQVTHGLADSASKLTGTISSGLHIASMDANYQQERERSKNAAKDSVGHLKSGLSSLTQGFVSGLSGVFVQPVRGAKKEGVEGLFSGVVKGLVGVVAKPVAGVFDMASETTAAIKHSAAPSKSVLVRNRLPRSIGPDRRVRQYRSADAKGQDILFNLNKNFTDEKFVSRANLGVRRHIVVVTSERVLILDHVERHLTVSLEIWYSGLYRLEVIQEQLQQQNSFIFYVQFLVSEEMTRQITDRLELSHTSATPLTPPTWKQGCAKKLIRIRCDDEVIARTVLENVQFALNFYSERRHLVQPSLESALV